MYQYFLPFSGLHFHYVERLFEDQKLLVFVKYNLLFILLPVSLVLSKRKCKNQLYDFLCFHLVFYGFLFMSLTCFYFGHVLKYILFVAQSVEFWKLVFKYGSVILAETLKICPPEISWDVIDYVF